MAIRLSRAEFQHAVEQALRAIPPRFAPYMRRVVVDVEPQPSPALLAELEIEDAEELLGVYLGTPLTEQSVEHPDVLPQRVVVFQRNLEDVCRTREELVEEIRLTVLHEVGHHFGLDEGDLDELGYG